MQIWLMVPYNMYLCYTQHTHLLQFGPFSCPPREWLRTCSESVNPFMCTGQRPFCPFHECCIDLKLTHWWSLHCGRHELARWWALHVHLCLVCLLRHQSRVQCCGPCVGPGALLMPAAARSPICMISVAPGDGSRAGGDGRGACARRARGRRVYRGTQPKRPAATAA